MYYSYFVLFCFWGILHTYYYGHLGKHNVCTHLYNVCKRNVR